MDPAQAQFEAEIIIAIACSPRISAFKVDLAKLVEPSDRELFSKLLTLALQYTYAEGMRAGGDWMLKR